VIACRVTGINITEHPEPSPTDQAEQFARQAMGKPAGLLRELTDFLRHNKKWWLVPIILVLLLVSALVRFEETV